MSSDELEPYIPEITPTTIYGPDDWRPYADNPEPPISDAHRAHLRDVLDDLLKAAGQQERRKAYTYDPHAAAEYTDPLNVRERSYGRATRDSETDADGTERVTYRMHGTYLSDALRQAQAQERMEFAMRLQDPKNIIRVTGTGA